MIQQVSSDEAGKTFALLSLENQPMFMHEDPHGAVYRTWRLRKGQRYEIRVPLETFEDAYVFPSGAVAEDGAEKIVFLKSGDGFTKIPVEVLYQDHEVVVLPSTADIFPGNPIVVQGSFALSLALQSGGGSESTGHEGHAH
jgi:hypothetical protein